MQDQQEVRRIPLGVVAGISAVILATGGAGWFAVNSILSSSTKPIATTPQSGNSVRPSTEVKVQVYWLNNINNRIEVIPSSITLKDAAQPSEIIDGALKSLLNGPANPAVTTTIPLGTKLRKLSVSVDGIHVDLSQDFTTGGGSASMTGRVAQILYTATTLNPTAQVWIEVEGKPLEILGGEGLMLDQPLTRENFQKNFAL